MMKSFVISRFFHPLFFLLVATFSLSLLCAPFVIGDEGRNSLASVSAPGSLRSEKVIADNDTTAKTDSTPSEDENDGTQAVPLQYRRSLRSKNKNVCCSQCYRKDHECLKACRPCNGTHPTPKKYKQKSYTAATPKKYKQKSYTAGSQKYKQKNYTHGSSSMVSSLLPSASSITATIAQFLPISSTISSSLDTINSLIDVGASISHSHYDRQNMKNTRRSCKRAGEGAYAAYCQKKCSKSLLGGFSAKVNTPDAECREYCREEVRESCRKHGCEEYGCYVAECYDWAPKKCN